MKPQIPWLRVFVEGVVIVGSILLMTGCGSNDPTELPTLVSLSVEGGEGSQFTAIVTRSDGATEDVTTAVAWTSSDTSVLTISATGLAGAVGAGPVEICAAYQGLSDCMPLTVIPPPRIMVGSDSVAFFAGVAGTPPAPQTLQVTNGGGGSLGGLVTDVQFAPGQPTGWLTPVLASTHSPTTLTLTPQTTTLPLGVYEAIVTLTSPDDYESPLLIPVTLTLTSN